MIHKIVGWLFGYVQFFVDGTDLERFVNLCRNNGIELWGIFQKEGRLYANMRLGDFWNIRRIAGKCHVAPRVTKRVGMPFVLQFMWFHLSYCIGVGVFFISLVFLSGRIWGIEVSGESYHTKESIIRYLETEDIYSGMFIKDVPCEKIEELLRAHYPDIGWVSVKLSGSKIFLVIKEVTTSGEISDKKTPGNLVAETAGTVTSIVTSRGTAKVRAGKKVKKGAVLISGKVAVIGDGGETIETKRVHAEGEVVLRSRQKYTDSLPLHYTKRKKTGRQKKIYQFSLYDKSFFLYNPLKNLERYEKYDIIRESGNSCQFISPRFPFKLYCQSFVEVKSVSGAYSEEEAEKILRDRFLYYLQKKRDDGYVIVSSELKISRAGDSYMAESNIVQEKIQQKYRKIKKKKE